MGSINLFALIIIALILASAGGLTYYQFQYLPQLMEEERRAQEIPEELMPKEEVVVRLIEGSFNPEQPENFVPKEAVLVLGVNNSVVWINDDTVAHTVTSEGGSPDARFDREAHTTRWIQPGEEWRFIFTRPGTYNYYCVPHPWMRAKIIVVEA